MQAIEERLTKELRTLSVLQLAQVESFVASLQSRERDHDIARLTAPLSEPAFAAVWDNPEDEAYDAI
jgi:hypothetical protein